MPTLKPIKTFKHVHFSNTLKKDGQFPNNYSETITIEGRITLSCKRNPF